MSTPKRNDDDWSEYKKRDNRKRNHHDRTIRERKHRFEDNDLGSYIATQIFR